MPTDYKQITDENTKKYGTDIKKYGPVLLANLYSDRTHFVYELIQNAEDAGATHIEFQLFTNRLEIHHNGRPFSKEDVQGICGLVEGTKNNDLTKIGRFGIGFKSVYAYTHTPHVYSADEAFCIRNYVHPAAVPPPAALDEGETMFRLPFDHPDVPPEEAFKEIDKRLHNLGLRTLLFLRHMEQISWSIQDTGEGKYTRKSGSTRTTRLVHVSSIVHGQNERKEGWLVYERPLAQKPLSVEVAYQLKLAEDASQDPIIPTRNATLAAFFETEKETHLQFLIQGPYRTTPARDNIPVYDQWNQKLIRETAQLVCDSLSYLKERSWLKKRDWLTVNALSVLPIDVNDFPEGSMFRPIYTAVREKLKGSDAFLPTVDGKCVNAQHAYLARGRDLIDLLEPEQLMLLFGEKGHWLADTITRDRTPTLRKYLMTELGVLEIDVERFARQIDHKFMTAQDDAWIIKFYQYLSSHRTLLKKPKKIRNKWGRITDTQEAGLLYQTPIIRLSDETHVPPFTRDGEPNAYLPGDFSSSERTIKRSIVDHDEVRDFLASLGFASFDIYAEVVEHVLPKYQQKGLDVTANDRLEDHKKIAEALTSAPKTKRDKLITELRTLPFLVGVRRSTNERFLCPPDRRLYLSSTYTADRQLEQFLEHIGVASEVVWLDQRYAGIYTDHLLTEFGCIGKLDRVREIEEHILPKYHHGNIDVSEAESLRDAEAIVHAVKESKVGRRGDFQRAFETVPFLQAVNAGSGSKCWLAPDNIYLGARYTKDKDLQLYFEGNPDIYFLADFYEGAVSVDDFKTLGCRDEIEVSYHKPSSRGYVSVKDRHGSHERGLDGFDPEFRIKGLEHSLDTIAKTDSPKLAEIIWELLKPYRKTVYGTIEISTRQNFVNSEMKDEASRAGKILRESQWLPDQDGNFHLPHEIRLSDLPEIFDTESPAAKELAAKLGFRPEVDLSQFALEERRKIELGLSLTKEEIAEIEKLRKAREKAAHEEPVDSPDNSPNYEQAVRKVFDQPQENESSPSGRPAGPVPNPERRRKRTQKQIQKARQSEPSPQKRYDRILVKRWKAKDNDVKTFLKEQYQGRCQVCGDSFAKRDGDPYFEGLYLVSRKEADWLDRPGNVLCLCATCCAKFLHGEVIGKGDVVTQLKNAPIGGNGSGGRSSVELNLCGEEVELTYTERHLIDLQEMLKADHDST
jgi:hypothetical protein